MRSVPAIRIQVCNRAPVQSSRAYVLYWMIASRRLDYNFALDRALEHCRSLQKPLVVFEALRCGYRWASERIHRFVLDGMAENAAECERLGIPCYCYVEPSAGAGKGLLSALSKNACVVVTDEYPCFFLPRMVSAAAKKLDCCLETVDSNGLLPLRATERVFGRASDFRRFLQKALPAHLSQAPSARPLRDAVLPPATIPESVKRVWAPASAALLGGQAHSLETLPINHEVRTHSIRGGHTAARRKLKEFLRLKIQTYADRRNQPESDTLSGLSPYLHFGHISVHEIFAELSKHEKWSPQKLALRVDGRREGWWNMSSAAESFLDELVTWRELGYNFSSHRADYDRYESLPAWAQRTLQQHARDERSPTYTLEQFERAETHDSLWDAAQLQMVREGWMHGYMRMLWGKKILEWSRTPEEAAAIMIELNNKFAIDGRDPNSYSGIFWVLGRYDRPWGPERPVFGTIRYMSSENTARKFSVKKYVNNYLGSDRSGLSS